MHHGDAEDTEKSAGKHGNEEISACDEYLLEKQLSRKSLARSP
jgi:hypothetical protein